MAEKQSWLITKTFEPEGDYARSLRQIPGDEEDLAVGLSTYVKLREMSKEDAREVASRRHIESVELDGTMSIPEPVHVESATVTPAQARAFHSIDKAQAAGQKGRGETVFVLDTGLTPWAAQHLGARIAYKGSYVSGEDWTSANEVHGTWCLGTIADIATEARLGAIKVLSDKNGSGSTSGIVSGISEAVRQGATVISMSLGGGAQTALDNAVAAARKQGVSVAVAAGNSQRGSTAYNADSSSPAEERSVVTVAAVDSGSVLADFSNWGNCLDIAAIGVNILSDYVQNSWSGTSMATPHVAGMLGIVRGAGADATGAEKALYSSARGTGAPAYEEGSGIADAYAAIQKLSPQPRPTPTPKPAPAPAPQDKPISRYAAMRLDPVDKEYQVVKYGKPWATIGPPKS